VDVGALSAAEWVNSGGMRSLRAYARSKLANVLFTAELGRRLAGLTLADETSSTNERYGHTDALIGSG
jgi:hypothetical protein